MTPPQAPTMYRRVGALRSAAAHGLARTAEWVPQSGLSSRVAPASRWTMQREATHFDL